MASDGGLGPGTVLDGKYEILKRIGAGGMGEVFKARHLHLNAFRCIKVMKQGLLADDTYRTRFLREARLAVQIHHPNIAVVHDFFVGDGGNYMVTEFIDGTTLRQWSAAHGPFPIALAADVASQVLAGLDHIHRRGLLHRDISPDNVMLSYDADDRLEAKIIDLGIAKDVNTSAADKTMAGVLIGNPKYMSPEQLGLIDEDEELDGRTDLYSLGVVLYEMLLGVPPFASETPQGYIMKHLTQPPARFAEARPGMPVTGGIEQVVFRALEKDRTRRYRDARELAGALEPFLSARAGTLTRDDVSALRRGPEKTLADSIAMIGSNDATIAESGSTEVKARAFEQSLLDDVRARESER
ncbi:MAG TPA: serine/threonine-protein kinase, partial [Thermoanaerobaculia bacterium]|nr:serine/threonine-protein kinase [Thermoanaerobaculia bacterium]